MGTSSKPAISLKFKGPPTSALASSKGPPKLIVKPIRPDGSASASTDSLSPIDPSINSSSSNSKKRRRSGARNDNEDGDIEVDGGDAVDDDDDENKMIKSKKAKVPEKDKVCFVYFRIGGVDLKHLFEISARIHSLSSSYTLFFVLFFFSLFFCLVILIFVIFSINLESQASTDVKEVPQIPATELKGIMTSLVNLIKNHADET